jgi:membrane associated rhomboid family serine protease
MSAYRQSPFSNLTPVVKNLLIINIIVAVAAFVLRTRIDLGSLFGVYYFNSPHFKVWQLFTYMFMHAPLEVQPMHLLFNMLTLFMFGPILEYSLGPKRFLNLYFICGFGAIILQMLVQAIEVHSILGSFTLSGANVDAISSNIDLASLEKLKGIYDIPTVGASGAIFGLLVAFGMLYPNMELFILFIPVPVKAKYAIIGYVLIELFSGFGQVSGDNVAHFAHIGGALIGFIMVKLWRL